jgi:hypothetical protein
MGRSSASRTDIRQGLALLTRSLGHEESLKARLDTFTVPREGAQAAGRIHPSNLCARDPRLVNRGGGRNGAIRVLRDGASFRHPSTDASESGNLQVNNLPEDANTMSKPVKTEAELIAMARAELKVHVDCPEGIVISVIPDGDSWEFRAKADDATIAKPGYPECVAMLVQIGDHLCKQYDFKG